MVNKEAGINTRDGPISDLGAEETTSQFSLPNVTDWRGVYDSLTVIADERELNVVDTSYKS